MEILLLSSARWSGEQLSKQHLAIALGSLGHEVLYVDPPVSPLSPLRHPARLRDLLSRQGTTPRTGVRVWTPRVLPGQNTDRGQRWNARLLTRRLRTLCPAPDAVVTFSLEARTVVRSLSGLHVYYCTDSAEDLPGTDSTTARNRELALARDADLVVACSLPLQRQLSERGVTSHYLPHGAELLSRRPAGLPPPLRGLARPLMGYVGSLNFRVDAALLRRLLEELEGTLVLIGGYSPAAGPSLSPEARQLLQHPRVVATGHVDTEEVVTYLEAFDIGLVPYVNDAFNEKSFPLKIPQYLRSGLPVVSTPNGATEEYAELVAVARTPAEFAEAARRELEQDTEERRAARRDRIAVRTWSVVAEELVTLCHTTA